MDELLVKWARYGFPFQWSCFTGQLFHLLFIKTDEQVKNWLLHQFCGVCIQTHAYESKLPATLISNSPFTIVVSIESFDSSLNYKLKWFVRHSSNYCISCSTLLKMHPCLLKLQARLGFRYDDDGTAVGINKCAGIITAEWMVSKCSFSFHSQFTILKALHSTALIIGKTK